MAEKSLRQLIDEMSHLEKGDNKVYYPTQNHLTKTTSLTSDWVNEGAIGALVGGGLGAVAGGALGGGLGAVAGGALGAVAGDKIGDWLDPATKTTAVGAPEGAYVSTSGNGSDGGVSSNYKTVNGKHTDNMGNTKQDYTPMPGVKPLVGQLSLQTSSPNGDFAKLLNRLDTVKVAQCWQYNGAFIALAFKDEADPTTADDQGNLGIWVDLADFSKSALTTGGGKEEVDYFKNLGFKLQGSSIGTTKTSLGGAVVYSYKLSSGILSRDIGLFEINADFAYKYQGKKGLSQVQATFTGPMKTWLAGGQEQLDQLMNSLQPAPGVEPLSPLNGVKSEAPKE